MEKPDPLQDIDLLKADWNKVLNQKADDAPFAGTDHVTSIIHNKMKQQSIFTLKRLRENMLVEVLATIAMVIGCYFLFNNIGYHISPVMWAGICGISIVYHVWMYIKMRNGGPALQGNLKDTLQVYIRDFYVMVKMYRITGYILAAMVFVICMMNALLALKQADSNNIKYLIFAAQTCVAAFAGLGAFVAVKWYAQRLYGQHYETLLKCKEELSR